MFFAEKQVFFVEKRMFFAEKQTFFAGTPTFCSKIHSSKKGSSTGRRQNMKKKKNTESERHRTRSGELEKNLVAEPVRRSGVKEGSHPAPYLGVV